MNATEAGPVLMIMTVAISTYASHMPDVKDLRAADPNNPSACADMRVGEVVSGLMTLSVGAMASMVIGNYKPLLVAAATVAALTALYEGILRTDLVEKLNGGLALVRTDDVATSTAA